MNESGLGRRTPEVWRHVERYPLSAAPNIEIFRRTPVVLGINWFEKFGSPERIDGRYWIGRGTNQGPLQGGHAILVDHGQLPDRDAWWYFYDQGSLSACVGYSFSRGLTQLYKTLFNAVQLWNRAKAVDGFSDTNPGDNEGTTLDAGARILRSEGPQLHRTSTVSSPQFGISEYRWARNVDELLIALDSSTYATIGGVPLLQSWGDSYPRVVWLALEWLDDELRNHGGEACVFSRK